MAKRSMRTFLEENQDCEESEELGNSHKRRKVEHISTHNINIGDDDDLLFEETSTYALGYTSCDHEPMRRKLLVEGFVNRVMIQFPTDLLSVINSYYIPNIYDSFNKWNKNLVKQFKSQYFNKHPKVRSFVIDKTDLRKNFLLDLNTKKILDADVKLQLRLKKKSKQSISTFGNELNLYEFQRYFYVQSWSNIKNFPDYLKNDASVRAIHFIDLVTDKETGRIVLEASGNDDANYFELDSLVVNRFIDEFDDIPQQTFAAGKGYFRSGFNCVGKFNMTNEHLIGYSSWSVNHITRLLSINVVFPLFLYLLQQRNVSDSCNSVHATNSFDSTKSTSSTNSTNSATSTNQVCAQNKLDIELLTKGNVILTKDEWRNWLTRNYNIFDINYTYFKEEQEEENIKEMKQQHDLLLGEIIERFNTMNRLVLSTQLFFRMFISNQILYGDKGRGKAYYDYFQCNMDYPSQFGLALLTQLMEMLYRIDKDDYLNVSIFNPKRKVIAHAILMLKIQFKNELDYFGPKNHRFDKYLKSNYLLDDFYLDIDGAIDTSNTDENENQTQNKINFQQDYDSQSTNIVCKNEFETENNNENENENVKDDEIESDDYDDIVEISSQDWSDIDSNDDETSNRVGWIELDFKENKHKLLYFQMFARQLNYAWKINDKKTFDKYLFSLFKDSEWLRLYQCFNNANDYFKEHPGEQNSMLAMIDEKTILIFFKEFCG